MSRVIALEASSENCSVAILDGENCHFLSSDKPRSHANVMLPMLDDLLRRSGISLSSADAIAITHGPGSFTGIRISMSIAQGLAYGAKLPVIPVSTLELLAYQAIKGQLCNVDQQPLCHIVPAIDARMNEVYWSVYGVNGDTPHAVSEPSVGSIESINSELTQTGNTNYLVGVGNGWALDGIDIGCLSIRDERLVPDARDLASLAEKLMREGRARNIFEVEPLYLRNEVSWNKRTRIRNS